jgi:hypothetical protein
MESDQNEGVFPVHNGDSPRPELRVQHIPWAMLQRHEGTASRNHGGQSLARLALRGGISALEILCILNAEPWHKTRRRYQDDDQAHKALAQKVQNWRSEQAQGSPRATLADVWPQHRRA